MQDQSDNELEDESEEHNANHQNVANHNVNTNNSQGLFEEVISSASDPKSDSQGSDGEKLDSKQSDKNGKDK